MSQIFVLLILLGILRLGAGTALANDRGTIEFSGMITIKPAINPIQFSDLSIPNQILMSQGIGSGGALINLDIQGLTGKSEGMGIGSLNSTALGSIEGIQLQGFDGKIQHPGLDNNGLYSGLQGMKTSIGGGYNLLIGLLRDQ